MDHRIVITGANLGAILDGTEAPMWKTFSVREGQILSFPKPITGSIAYIIPEGGFSASRFLGSKSSYYKGQIGETINKETILYANSRTQRRFNRGLLNEYIPSYEQEISIELFKSPHMKLFKQYEYREVFGEFIHLSRWRSNGVFFQWANSWNSIQVVISLVKQLNLEPYKFQQMVSQLSLWPIHKRLAAMQRLELLLKKIWQR